MLISKRLAEYYQQAGAFAAANQEYAEIRSLVARSSMILWCMSITRAVCMPSNGLIQALRVLAILLANESFMSAKRPRSNGRIVCIVDYAQRAVRNGWILQGKIHNELAGVQDA